MNDEATEAHIPHKHDATIDQSLKSSIGDVDTIDTPDPPAKPFPQTDAPPGFTILSKLGEGGMGVVYLAMQDGLKRKVALKMIRGAADEKSHAHMQANRNRQGWVSALPEHVRRIVLTTLANGRVFS